MTKSARLVEEFYNGTAEKDWPCWGQEIVSEVESRRAACSSLPDGPVVNDVGVRVDASPDALRAVADQVAEVFGPARRGAEKAALIRNAAFLLGRVSLPDGGAAERLTDDEFMSAIDSAGIECEPEAAFAIKAILDRAALAAPSAQPPEHYAMLQMLQECKEYLRADPSTVGGRPEAERLVKRIEETMKGQQ